MKWVRLRRRSAKVSLLLQARDEGNVPNPESDLGYGRFFCDEGLIILYTRRSVDMELSLYFVPSYVVESKQNHCL